MLRQPQGVDAFPYGQGECVVVFVCDFPSVDDFSGVGVDHFYVVANFDFFGGVVLRHISILTHP